MPKTGIMSAEPPAFDDAQIIYLDEHYGRRLAALRV